MENDSDRAAFGVESSCRYLGISRPTLYRLMGQGAIPSFHIGRRRLLLKTDLDRFLEALAQAEAGR